jgi:16S rRNA (cytosine967-C5)-methyltransferase
MQPHSRLIALNILNEVDQDKNTLDHILEAAFTRFADLPQREKNLTFSIVYGVLRYRYRLDWILGHFSRTGTDKLDPEIRNILRIGLFQVVYLNRIPPSAAVHTAVDLAKTLKKPWLAKFVNAVLRAAVGKYPELKHPNVENDPISAIAVETSMPPWLIYRWIPRFGLSEARMLCNSTNDIPPLTLRVNTLKTTRSDFLESAGVSAHRMEATSFSPDGLRLDHPQELITAMPGFQDGLFLAQDEAAQLVTLLLDPQPEETVLDACAGMGGKTGHIAQQMRNTGHILATDISSDKLKRIHPEMRRLGISIVDTQALDLSRPIESSRTETFDRVLLDAPCSGLGVLRRNPDIKWKSSPERIAHCQIRQIDFLGRASQFVKPSGVLVYAVCSMEPEENESVVMAFLSDHSEFTVAQNAIGMSPHIRSLITPEGYLKTFPHLHGMDGFFAVRFRRCA